MKNIYGELEDLFNKISDNDKRRLVLYFVCGLSQTEVAKLEKRHVTAINYSLHQAEEKLQVIRKHNEAIAAIQILFQLP